MLIGEYDYATDIAVQREEAAQEAWGKAWVKIWGEAWGEAMERALNEAWKEGARQNALQNARNLKRLGVPLEIISQGVWLNIEEIENL